MAEIVVFQTDNRLCPGYPFEFIPMDIQGNRRVCETMGWRYEFREMKAEYYADSHPAVGKIFMVRDFIKDELEGAKGTEGDKGAKILVFLDTDAWIQNPERLQRLATDICQAGKMGAFSRDPYIKKNTYINSGSFVLRLESATQMYDDLVRAVEANPAHKNEWPWDQIYVSEYVWQNREQFFVFKPDVLNTAFGKILRHNWHKTSRKIRDEIFMLCYLPIVRETGAVGLMEGEVDDAPYPNASETGYDYMDFD